MDDYKLILSFDAPADAVEIIDEWAKKSTFIEGMPLFDKTLNKEDHTYCFHVLDSSSITYLSIDVVDGKINLESWLTFGFLQRLLSMFILPKHMPLNSKSVRGVMSRMNPKKSLNKLLEKLGQEKI